MVGIAVNVVLLPVHIDSDAVLILTEGITIALVVIVRELLMTVGVFAQIALLIITTVTTSLLARALVVKLVLLVPTFTPLIFH